MSKRSFASRPVIAGSGTQPFTNLEQKSREVVKARGVGDQCDFRVRYDGQWCVFDGKVDSQTTKSELFALVPEVDGATWIVDKLRTGVLPRRGPGLKR